ncbi:HPr kinase [Deferribacter desulfuricans SSM1]|uniref:HPr kinase/phosphorylase n=1 Tax=Deferribacter desulfuricans (strain DSM 14783 / JCM 11476 / NBRC 101012 / SSM1) TaxID=639282 RepID=D3PD44_DEFDS|nr:HPr(Ser) kinase/phosphatase [Deferribacter desulfuricans]BAI80517.1 HPr kinase [Deferribacter desulfuricans SSM1]
MKSIPVSELLAPEAEGLKLKLIYGKKHIHEKFINNHRIQKPGLGLAGYTDHIHEGRVQILGNTEISYLNTLHLKQRYNAILGLCKKNISCFVVTKNQHIPKVVIDACKECSIPILKTPLKSSVAISEISSYLEEKLAPTTNVHGVLVDVHGVGVLIMGRSGIGKSECALELVKRGHRLVADDVVIIKRKQDFLVGFGDDLLVNHLEVRGLGILNIKEMYGIGSIRLRKKVEVVVKLIDWDKEGDYDRLGIDKNTFNLLDVELPLLNIPVSPGRNIAIIVEAAARNHLLKLMGFDAAVELNEKINKAIKEKQAKLMKNVFYKKGVE